MLNNARESSRTDAPWFTYHPATSQDKSATAAMRTIVEPNKGRLQGTSARAPYNELMNRVVAPGGVTYETQTISGIPGWWCRPENAQSAQAVLHLHGGWFNWGSAEAFRHLVGHLAAASNVAAFIPDYRLAPEHPFPSAVEDVQACFTALVGLGFRQIAVTGDSAGGGLALLLLSRLIKAEATSESPVLPVGAVVLSPVTDLTLSRRSWETRAAADPYFTKPQVTELVTAYLNGHDPFDPAASPLYGKLEGLPPIRIHVGEDEVLLDDALGFAERAVDAEVDAAVHVWECMAHGFLSGIGKLSASTEALAAIGTFLKERLRIAAA